MGKIKQFHDYESLSSWAYEHFKKRYIEKTEKGNPFFIAFSGGTSPEGFWAVMSKDRHTTWRHLHIFFVDERAVPHDSQHSNYRLLREKLLKNINIPGRQIFPIQYLPEPEESARRYENTLKESLTDGVFDLIVAGVGQDGHIASIFPESETIKIIDRLVVPVYNSPIAPRITLTLPVFWKAREVLLILSGEKKKEALLKIMDNSVDESICPAKAVLKRNNALLLTDIN